MYVDQEYFTTFEEIPSIKYDLCLVHETIEHVDNIQLFISNLAQINAAKFLITAPNAFAKIRQENYNLKDSKFTEIVHPDHNAWFSPYTLKNVIEKYSNLKVTTIYLINDERTVACEALRS